MNDTQASISIISARSKVTEMLKKKKDDVKNLKEEIKEFLQQHQKAERRQMKLRKSRRNEIFNTEQRIRD
jgi:Na+/phosphate symporter